LWYNPLFSAGHSVVESSRILWACRRGMLELDLLLGPYAKEVYPHLDASKQRCFEALLEQEDQLLFDCFMGKRSPNASFLDCINEVQQYAKR